MTRPVRHCPRWSGLFFVSFMMGCASTTGARGNGGATTLRTTHITLYDCGLSQVEQQADVQGAARFSIPTTAGKLDGLAASLTVVSTGNVSVTGVEYDTPLNLVQAVTAGGFARSMISEEDGYQKTTDFAGYARALTGIEVTVQKIDKSTIRGTVLDSVDRARPTPAVAEDEDTAEFDSKSDPGQAEKVLLIAGAGGVLTPVPLEEVAALAPVSEREGDALHRFAASLGKTRGYGETEVHVTTGPKSTGRLAVGFVREAPLWRTLYTLRPSKGGILLEAWAVVHNDSPDDWENVGFTLVAGLPSSYVMSVASPRYRNRDFLFLDESNDAMTPQLGAATPDSLMYPSVLVGTEMGEAFGSGGLGLTGIGAGGGGTGYGTAVDRITLGGQETPSSLLSVGMPAAAVQTRGEVEDEISRYESLVPVTLRKGASAMVPILRKTLSGEAFVLIEGSEAKTCMRTVNRTGLVLQRGVASVYIDGRFRGQTRNRAHRAGRDPCVVLRHGSRCRRVGGFRSEPAVSRLGMVE